LIWQLTKFFLVLAVVALAILGGGYFWDGQLPSFFYPSLVLAFVSTAGLFSYLIRIHATKPDYFVQLYLLTIAVKVFAYGSYLGYVAYSDREGAGINIVFFMVVYVIFTALEVGFLWRRFNP